jgi:hypothetical protein
VSDQDEPEPEPEAEAHYHYYYDGGAREYTPPVRLPPANPDPAATYDALYRKLPRVLGFIDFCRVIGGFAPGFRTAVPDESVTRLGDGEVEIACPCGATPRLRWNGVVACACDRVFGYCGGPVFVAYTGDSIVDYEHEHAEPPAE